jgi:hypothetical protein
VSASRIFLLSPANCGGLRAKQVLSSTASFDVAARLRSPHGATLGEIFSFVSGLYFRGKLAYARRFARADPASELLGAGVLVITPGAGLRSADTRVTRDAVERFAGIDIDLGNEQYLRPLVASARAVRDALDPDADIVLLGSIASSKYVEPLVEIFGERLLFPGAFVGRGDMSRGGLLLRHVEAGVELEYTAVAGAVRRGTRPPKLAPSRRESR